MMKVKLTRLLSTNKNLRTQEVLGVSEFFPTIGRPFEMISGSLTPENDYRYIGTSLVTSVAKIGQCEYIFTTENSTYKLLILTEDEFNEEKLLHD